MNQASQQKQCWIQNNYKTIEGLIQFRQLHKQIQKIKRGVTEDYVQKNNHPAYRNMHSLLMKYLDANKNIYAPQIRQQFLANINLSLAMISQMVGNGKAESKYLQALFYDQQHSQINLSLALFLYHQKKYREALKYLNKLSVATAFKQKHRESIWRILLYKVEEQMYLKLRKMMICEKQISKVQFIKKIMKFKEAFFYRCVEIQELSQYSYDSLAFLLFYKNRFADSLTLAYKLRKINQPPTQDIQQTLSCIFYRFGRFKESVQCAQQGLRINPKNQQIYPFLITSLMKLFQFSQATVHVKQFIHISKYNSQAYQLMGIILTKQGGKQLGLDYYRLGVIVQPSKISYLLLAKALQTSSRFSQAQRCYLKSIEIEPNQESYLHLGLLYFKFNAYLNAISCFFKAISQNYLQLPPYFYLGLCAQRLKLFRLIINGFIETLKSSFPSDEFLQVLVGAYRFASNQSPKQLYAFLTAFIQERKKGGEKTKYEDIAKQLINNQLPLKYESKVLLLILGVLSRAKEQHYTSRFNYYALFSKQKIAQLTLSDAFTSLYQQQIMKIPKGLQSTILQYITAEMVKQSPAQALKCFNKSLSYARGDYQQFYTQFNKKIEGEIDLLQQIDFVINCIPNIQQLDQDDLQRIGLTMNLSIFAQLNQYVKSLENMQKLYKSASNRLQRIYFKNIQINNFPKNIIQLNMFIHKTLRADFLSLVSALDATSIKCRTNSPQIFYHRIFQQMNIQNKFFKKRYKRIQQIYNNSRQRNQRLYLLMEQQVEGFFCRQKVIFIFNHFHPYIITERCHKQFAVILHKIKDQPNYRTKELMKDLRNMFLEGNKHTNKVVTAEQFGGSIGETWKKERKIVLEELYSQTFSQIDTRIEDSRMFDQFEDSKFLGQSESQQNLLDNTDRKSQEFEKSLQNIDIEPQANQFCVQTTKITKSKKIQWVEERKDDQSIEYQSSNSSQEQLQMHQSQIESTLEEVKWYQSNYTSSNNQFNHNQKLYEKFNELLYLNTFSIIKHLQKNSENKYIAKHICQSTYITPKDNFTVLVQLADQDYVSNSQSGQKQLKTLRWIRRLGPIHIIRWIAHIALGISELQNLGIYHADIAFRNTIRVTIGVNFYFKIIDFDKSFKVCQADCKDTGYEITKGLFDFWLKFRFDDSYPRAPIYDIECFSVSSQKATSTFYDPKDIITYIFKGAEQPLIQQLLAIKDESIFQNGKRVNKCLKLLKEHMRVSHFKQYSALVHQLLEGHQKQKGEIFELIDPSIRRQILKELERLEAGEVDYINFAKTVEDLGERKQQLSENSDNN